MPEQIIKVTRAPEQPPVDLMELKAWLWQNYPGSEWIVNEIELDILRNRMAPLKSIYNTITLSYLDWANSNELAWIYGIVVGWDIPVLKALDDVAKEHKWPQSEKNRLIMLHKKFKALQLLETD